MMLRPIVVGCLVSLFAILHGPSAMGQEKKLVVGSKEFTEQRILGRVMISLLEKNGFSCDDRTGLGGTLAVRTALEKGRIHIYMEYTGVALGLFLKEKKAIGDPKTSYDTAKATDASKNKIVWLPAMSMNSAFCLMMPEAEAEKRTITNISELAKYVTEHPKELTLGLTADFHGRRDGFGLLEETYKIGFPPEKIVLPAFGDIVPRLQEGAIQLALGIITDGRVKSLGLRVLVDDKAVLPALVPAPVVTEETAKKYPELEEIFSKLSGPLDTAAMRDLHHRVEGEGGDIKAVVDAWLAGVGLL